MKKTLLIHLRNWQITKYTYCVYCPICAILQWIRSDDWILQREEEMWQGICIWREFGISEDDCLWMVQGGENRSEQDGRQKSWRFFPAVKRKNRFREWTCSRWWKMWLVFCWWAKSIHSIISQTAVKTIEHSQSAMQPQGIWRTRSYPWPQCVMAL